MPDGGAPRRPVVVRCTACEYVWVPIFLPAPLADVAKALGQASCPQCRAGTDRVVLAGKDAGR